MGIKECIKELSFDEAKELGLKCENVLAYEISRIVFGVGKSNDINWEECTEVFFFDETKQVHMIHEGDEWKSVVFEDKTGNPFVEKTYKLISKLLGECKNIVKREYLDNDEDGQTYVVYTRLVSIQ